MNTLVGPRSRSENGMVAVLTAVLAVSLLLAAAFVVDLGSARYTRGVSQNAADASALAATNVLYPSGSCSSGAQPPCLADALSAAKAYARANFNVTDTEWASCTDPTRPAGFVGASGDTPCISFDSLTAPTQVRVRMTTKTLRSGLGRLAGVGSIAVRSTAVAAVTQGAKCALCFLGNVSTNNTDFTVTGGSIAVKGNISAGPNSNWRANAIGVVGSESGGNFAPAWTTIPTFSDPFASMALPLPTSTYTSKTDPCSQGAAGGSGIYGDVNLPNSTCNLQPGVYVITGAWGAKNNTLLTSSGGVTLYLKSTGSIDFKNGDVNLTAPTSGATAGFVLLADRDMTNPISLQGNGGTQMSGKVYAANAGLSFNGNSCFGFSGGPVVVGGASSVGNKSCVDVRNAADVTVSPGSINLSQ